ncbi:AAA-like domain-containing protein [Pannus brasiliensis CCIBt3594]|uniref:AAA-like domain-containing protein n=1 Tax=Pannus brasiliensis CCIBt3594 TaxID=1427578 RepID=A0AAW9QY16_9CHRO
MTIHEIIALLNADPATRLDDKQESVLRLSWEGYTYLEMAPELHYEDSYLRNIAGPLWRVLTRIFGTPINKNNFYAALHDRPLTDYQTRLIRAYQATIIQPSAPASIDREPDAPSIPDPYYGPIHLASTLYLERPPIEDLACAEIEKPGGVLRIRSPARTGKTSLLLRVLHAAREKNYRTVTLNCTDPDPAQYGDIERFLQWFCREINRQLHLDLDLEDYWQEEAGSKVNCSLYVQNHLLDRDDRPLVLALEEVHQLFDKPDLAREFFPLLRSWHENSKIKPIWQKLRLIVVHSTDLCIPLGLDRSPFNIGLTLTLPGFTPEQTRELARRYGINWSDRAGREKALTLTKLIGGHPYYTQLALYHLRWGKIDWAAFLAEAATPKGIYSDHLRELSLILRKHPELAAAWKKTLDSPEPIEIEALAVYKLESLGLVKREATGVVPGNELYRSYFQQQLSLGNYTFTIENYISRLERENKRLVAFSLVDELTGRGSRLGFELSLEREWVRLARASAYLSLLLCEIDRFESVSESNETEAILQGVGEILAESARRTTDYVALYENASFAILLPNIDRAGAYAVAEKIQTRLSDAALSFPAEDGDRGPVTVSIGIAICLVNFHDSPDSLKRAAEEALDRSRSNGGNRVTVARS